MTQLSAQAIQQREGFTEVVGQDVGPADFSGMTIEPVPFLTNREDMLDTEAMRQLAKDLAGTNLGLMDALYWWDNRNLIPPECDDWTLVFPGTLLEGWDGGFAITCLEKVRGTWRVKFRWTEDLWSYRDCFLRGKKL